MEIEGIFYVAEVNILIILNFQLTKLFSFFPLP